MDRQDIARRLAAHYEAVERIILARQHPVTGLLPASTAVTAHGDYTDAWVRDNVYSVLAVWGLGLAYRRHDPAHPRAHLLGQSSVKLMRGLLLAMMRQAAKVEAFKCSRDPADALHAKYDTETGLPVVGDAEWGHLQLDATALFLLMLAQMTASGLRIVFTHDEVDFVQNLVHYISRSFCTPDYGIWERGNKINHGEPELNASSVGMAKAALEAMAGFDLFGLHGDPASVVHVVPSDIARARITLEGLLPRESVSKEVDAALLAVIGYPAYAVEDAALAERTRDKIRRKLEGRHGCKRFLLDGHQTVLEDVTRLHYEPSELQKFAGIECEWPLFFAYIALDAELRGARDVADDYRRRLEGLLVARDGQRLVPELYYVPAERVAAEKAAPGSQPREPNENVPLVWAQSLYILAQLLGEGLLAPADIDPLGRRRRLGYHRTTRVLTPVLAADERVRERLLGLGFESETVAEVAPVAVRPAADLAYAYTWLGRNDKLQLSGRPLQPPRVMASARLHHFGERQVLFLPYFFDVDEFYLGLDNRLLVGRYRASLDYIASHWDYPGQPIVPFHVTADMLDEAEQAPLLALLDELRRGRCGSVHVRQGPLAQLLTTASQERIARLRDFHWPPPRPRPAATGFLAEPARETSRLPDAAALQAFEASDDDALAARLQASDNRLEQAELLRILVARHGLTAPLPGRDGGPALRELAEALYARGRAVRDWALVRRMADLLGKWDSRLEDALTDVVIRQKRLALGRAYDDAATLSQPLDSPGIVRLIERHAGGNPAEHVLSQELLLYVGQLMRSDPALFDGLLTIRLWYLVQLLVGQLAREHGEGLGDAYERLIGLPPHAVYDRLRATLQSLQQEVRELAQVETIRVGGELARPERVLSGEAADPARDWLAYRREHGMLTRHPPGFYQGIWHVLRRVPGLVIGDKYDRRSRLGTELTHDSTSGEQGFALRVDALLQGIAAPEYRQLTVEALHILARLFDANRSLTAADDLVLDVLIGHAVRIAWQERHPEAGLPYDEVRGQAWREFYRLPPAVTGRALVRALQHLFAQAAPAREDVA